MNTRPTTTGRSNLPSPKLRATFFIAFCYYSVKVRYYSAEAKSFIVIILCLNGTSLQVFKTVIYCYMKTTQQGLSSPSSRHPLPLLSFLFFLFLVPVGLLAQDPDLRVSGTVVSSTGAPLEAASVQVKNSARGTTTDAEGKFSILVPGNGTLVISFAGFQSQEVAVGARTVINVILQQSTDTSSNEVVVVGYTTQRRSSISGAYSTVNLENTQVRRVSDVAQVLQGQVPGLNVTSSTGAPGDDISIRIRGEGTIGNNSPLFIVDGMPSRDINFLSPSDIASITVLRDASAAAIYGSRGSAGVIVITTKTGKKGRSSLDLNYFNGIQRVGNLPKMLNAQQYMSKMEESWNNSDFTGTNPYTTDKARTDLANTNWLDELFETGRSQNVQLTASGGSDKVQYLLSGTYYEQDGIVKFDNDRLRRLTLRSNITANITDRFRLGSNLQLATVNQSRISSRGDAPGIIRHALIRPPVIPVYKDPSDPTWTARDPFTDLPFYHRDNAGLGVWDTKYELTSNPVALAYFTNDKRNNFKTFGNIFAEYGFLKNQALKLRSSVGIDLNMTHNKTFNENFGDDNNGGDIKDKGLGRQNRPNSLSEDRGEAYSITWNNTLNYSTKINRHSISGLVGTEYITNKSNSIGGSRRRFEYFNPAFQYLDYGNNQNLEDIWSSGSGTEWALFSVFGSATYMYDAKYMLTANFRADGSSRFGPNNKWGYFPSVSAGWRISEENFMKGLTWLSDLRLRASTGSLGNQEIGDYNWQTLMYKRGDEYGTLRYGNPDLKWETTHQTNLGVDVGIARKLSVSVDYFIKKTDGILLGLQLPGAVGDVQATIVNAAQVTNKGVELALSYKNYDHAFKYSLTGNLAATTNNVDKLHPNLPVIIGSVYRTQPGHPLSAFYGYQMEGIYQNAAEVKQHLFGVANPGQDYGQKPGDIKFRDLNNDGIIDDRDRTFIGNPIPKYTYGFTMAGSYKNFDLNILFQGVQGVDKFNDMRRITDYDSRPFNHSVRTLDAWHGEGTSNTTPRSTFKDNGSSRISDIFVEDASYLRLKNVELGYSFKSVLGKAIPQIQNLRVYVSAQNIFTITNYKGLDPESTDIVDMGTYPMSKAFLFGVNVTF